MSSLVDAFKSLIPSNFTVYDGQVADDSGNVPEPPWVFLRFPHPDTLDRALSGDRHGLLIEGEALLYNTDVDALRMMAAAFDAALDGKRPTLSGWSFGRIHLDSPVGPAQDRDVKYDGRHPLVISIDFTFVATKGS